MVRGGVGRRAGTMDPLPNEAVAPFELVARRDLSSTRRSKISTVVPYQVTNKAAARYEKLDSVFLACGCLLTLIQTRQGCVTSC